MLGDVEQDGWHHLRIHPSEGDPRWSFTIGLAATWEHPELIVFGLPYETCHDVLWTAARAIAGGARYEPGRSYDEFLEGYPARFVEVPPHWYAAFMGYAQWFHESSTGFRVLQFVWPDARGRFPWDEGWAVPAGKQPVLSPGPGA